MTNLQRLTGKIFGETATATGDDPQIGQFGSALNGTYVGTTDVATIQSLPAWSNGFIDSVTPNEQFPPLPEMTGFGKVLSYQTAYTLQKGVPEWDAGTTYYTGDFCKGIGEGKLYVSKIDSNINNDLTDTNSWEEFAGGGATRNIGEIVASTIPLTDAGLHLLDGALLQYGSYQAFIDYIADLYDSGDYSAIFETEANWQSAVTTYGVCGKFVYDDVNNTVRLPKYSNKIYTNMSTAPVIGTGKALGFKTGAGTYLGTAGTGNGAAYWNINAYGKEIGDPTYNPAGGGYTISSPVGVTTDSTKSGIIADLSNITTSLDGYYYIVVATSTKTDIQVDIDEIATDLNGKADVDLSNVTNTSGFRKLVKTYKNGDSWYKVFNEYDASTGTYIGQWCEQGGKYTRTATGAMSISYTKDNFNALYINAIYQANNIDTTTYPARLKTTPTTSGFVLAGNSDSIANFPYVIWEAKGYLS